MKMRATYHGKVYEVVYYNRIYRKVFLKDFGCPFEAPFDEVKFLQERGQRVPKYAIYDAVPMVFVNQG
jgi:hypothetical protein